MQSAECRVSVDTSPPASARWIVKKKQKMTAKSVFRYKLNWKIAPAPGSG